MSINSLEKYISNRLTNHLMRTGLILISYSVYDIDNSNKGNINYRYSLEKFKQYILNAYI